MSQTEDELATNNNPPKKIQNDRELWNEIIKESNDFKSEVEEFRRSKNPVLEPPPHPVIDYLNETVFPVLNSGIMKMLHKVKEQESQMFTEGDTYLNSLNFIAEYLWNMNPQHPERKQSWTQISQISWN